MYKGFWNRSVRVVILVLLAFMVSCNAGDSQPASTTVAPPSEPASTTVPAVEERGPTPTTAAEAPLSPDTSRLEKMSKAPHARSRTRSSRGAPPPATGTAAAPSDGLSYPY